MNQKEEAFNLLMQQILSFIDRFKFIDKAIENLCKKLCKPQIVEADFEELMKLYNTTGQMFIKALGILDSIVCRFPQELDPDELELIQSYRKLSEAEQFIYREKIKQDAELCKMTIDQNSLKRNIQS